MSRTTEREAAIRRILDARFSLAALEALREIDPLEWSAARNDMGRGIYGEAMRESRRLAKVSDAELEAELAAAALHEARRRFD
jgi:hypothetical protein